MNGLLKGTLWMLGIAAMIPAVAALQGCDKEFYETCPQDRIFGDWGVVNHTHTFGEFDSLYYVVNPIGNITDSVYYNGNYTDSYYHSDPVRAMLRYTADDSIQFDLHRLYATETNPRNIIMLVRDETDSLHSETVLYLRRKENDENLYSTGPDSLFKKQLLSGHELKITATNGTSSSEPQGSQNYEFPLYTAGFDKALHMADSLNSKGKAAKAPKTAKKGFKL